MFLVDVPVFLLCGLPLKQVKQIWAKFFVVDVAAGMSDAITTAT